MKWLKSELKDFLYYYGYTNHPKMVNDTAFFDYTDHNDTDVAQFK